MREKGVYLVILDSIHPLSADRFQSFYFIAMLIYQVGNSKIREEAMEDWNELWEKSNMISVYNYYYQIVKNNVVSMKFKTNY